jgi:hypothetical protein
VNVTQEKLYVKNNLTIGSNVNFEIGDGKDVEVGGNLVIESGATVKTTHGDIMFNGGGDLQQLSVAGAIKSGATNTDDGFYSITVDEDSKLQVNNNITVNNKFTLASGSELHDGVDNNIYTMNGDVIIAKIVEGLALQKHEIYLAALKYLEEAYRDTKYKIVINAPENGVVAGDGEYLQFHEDNYFPYSYFLNAPFTLRVDAKDGRARISVILSYYTGKRSNINETTDIHDRISEFQPIKEDEMERRKLYNKAFPALFKKAQKTLKEMEDALKSTRSSAPETDW